jgi:hypothetical protein
MAIKPEAFVKSPRTVTPVKTGVQNLSKQRNDENGTPRTFNECIKNSFSKI